MFWNLAFILRDYFSTLKFVPVTTKLFSNDFPIENYCFVNAVTNLNKFRLYFPI